MKISFNQHFHVKVLVDNLETVEVSRALVAAGFTFKILNFKRHPGYEVKMHEYAILCCMADATKCYETVRNACS
ncbi:MAG TPA: hypothetical protein VHA56_03195 [Mucilaginibacter sp.]|nr:hypothetical protein [Mucilaginibacter sp.]